MKKQITVIALVAVFAVAGAVYVSQTKTIETSADTTSQDIQTSSQETSSESAESSQQTSSESSQDVSAEEPVLDEHQVEINEGEKIELFEGTIDEEVDAYYKESYELLLSMGVSPEEAASLAQESADEYRDAIIQQEQERIEGEKAHQEWLQSNQDKQQQIEDEWNAYYGIGGLTYDEYMALSSSEQGDYMQKVYHLKQGG